MTGLSRVPADSTNPRWLANAACRGLGDDLFFAPDNERGQTKHRRESMAKAVCATCPVAYPCLTWALNAREAYGIWGGRTEAERLRLASSQPKSTRAVPG